MLKVIVDARVGLYQSSQDVVVCCILHSGCNGGGHRSPLLFLSVQRDEESREEILYEPIKMRAAVSSVLYINFLTLPHTHIHTYTFWGFLIYYSSNLVFGIYIIRIPSLFVLLFFEFSACSGSCCLSLFYLALARSVVRYFHCLLLFVPHQALR